MSRTVVADAFPLVTSSEDSWNESCYNPWRRQVSRHGQRKHLAQCWLVVAREWRIIVSRKNVESTCEIESEPCYWCSCSRNENWFKCSSSKTTSCTCSFASLVLCTAFTSFACIGGLAAWRWRCSAFHWRSRISASLWGRKRADWKQLWRSQVASNPRFQLGVNCFGRLWRMRMICMV